MIRKTSVKRRENGKESGGNESHRRLVKPGKRAQRGEGRKTKEFLYGERYVAPKRRRRSSRVIKGISLAKSGERESVRVREARQQERKIKKRTGRRRRGGRL